MKEVEKNPRLEWAFIICEMLGIDDPITWMNCCPVQMDWWVAYLVVKHNKEQEARDKASGKQSFKGTGEEVGSYLKGKYGGQGQSRGTVLRSNTGPS